MSFLGIFKSKQRLNLTPRYLGELIPRIADAEWTVNLGIKCNRKDQPECVIDCLAFTCLTTSYVKSAAAELNESALAELLARLNEIREMTPIRQYMGGESTELLMTAFRAAQESPPADSKAALASARILIRKFAGPNERLFNAMTKSVKNFQNRIAKEIPSIYKRNPS